MAARPKWFILGGGNQPLGPYTTSQMGEYFKVGQVTRETLCWAEGRNQWQCAEDIAELDAAFGALTKKDNTTQDTIGGLTGDIQLEAFKKEIAALEEDQPVDEVPIDRPESPEEKEFVDDDGTEYVWDSSLRKYAAKNASTVPEVKNQTAPDYSMDAMTFEGDDEKIPTIEEARKMQEESLKELEEAEEKAEAEPNEGNGNRGDDEENGEGVGKQGKKRKAPQQGWSDPNKTTSIYITGLPEDATIQEVVTVFGRCGIIRQDDERKPRVKIYRDKQTGLPKGDGLVTYLKRPSVDLAVQILDGTPFRVEMGQNMTVQEAKFEQKQGKAPKQQSKSKKKKKKGIRQEQLLGWGGFDDRLSSNKITVILKPMFRPDELVAEESLKEELEQDIQKECQKIGEVDKVVVFQSNAEGVVSVRFKTEEDADKCLELMNGRFFAGSKISAAKWDGFTNYHVKVKDTEEEEAARLEKFAQDLEGK